MQCVRIHAAAACVPPQVIEGLKVELPRTIQAPHQLENLKLLTDNKGFEAENLELKRRVQLGLLVQVLPGTACSAWFLTS